MRSGRFGSLVVVGLVALLITAAIALLLFVHPNDFRAEIEQRVREKTGRELSIGGKLELKLFPWLALSIRDVKLGNPPGFGSQPFFAVRSAKVGVKLLPLLRKRLEISRVAVEGLTIDLISRGDSNNWKDLNGTGSSSARGADRSGSTGPVVIAGIDISQSRLVFRDELKKSTMELSGLELHTGRIGGNEPTSVKVAFDYGDGGEIPRAHFTMDTQVASPGSGPGSAASVVLRKLAIQGSWRGAAVPAQTGQAPRRPDSLPFSLHAPQITLDTQAQTVAAPSIEARVGDLPVTVSVSGEKLFGDRLVSGVVNLPPVAVRKVMQSFGETPPTTRDPQALKALALQTHYHLSLNQLQLSGLELVLDETRVQGSAAIDDLRRMALSFDLHVNTINVDRYRAPVDKTASAPRAAAPGTRASAKTPTPLPVEALRKLNVNGMLRVGSAVFGGVVFSDLTTPLTARDGRVELGPSKARVSGGTYDGDVVLDARPPLAQLSLNEHVHGADMGALVKAAFDTARLSGRADANVAVTAVGNTDEALIRSLSGKIDTSVSQGALNGIDIAYELERAQALLKRESVPARTGPERTAFNSLQASATLDKGRLRNDDLRMATDFLKARGKGTVDLDTQALDYQIVASLIRPIPAGSHPAGSSDALEVPLVVTGTVANPIVRPDLQALVQGQLRRNVNEQLQRHGGDLQKQLGDKLNDLLKH